MNNLTTRKIVLGVLMALVLAFGVQGVVDAVTTNLPEGPIIDVSANPIEGPVSLTISGISAETVTVGEDAPTQTIRISTSNIQLTVPDFVTSVTLSNNPTGTQRLYSNNDTVSGYFRSVGVASITVTYMDLATDAEKAAKTQTRNISRSHTYRYYVVRSDTDIPETTVLQLTRDGISVNREGYITGLTGRRDFRIFSNNTGNYPVTFSVAGGSSALYFSDDPYMTTDPPIDTTISSSSGRKVWLDMNGDVAATDIGTTSVVRVRIGSNDSTTDNIVKSDFNVAYIFGTPKLDIDLDPSINVVGVDDVTEIDDDLRNRYRFTGGTAGEDAGMITATVHDGMATVTHGTPSGGEIEGVLVKFELQQKGSTAGYLSTTDTRVDERNNSEGLGSSPPNIAQTLYARTNGQGQAQVTYRFGTLGSQTINVSSVGLRKEVTAEIGTGQTDKQISVKTNRQQSGDSEKFDLVAEVEDGDGEPIDDVPVTFSTDRGTLTPVSAVPQGGTNTDEEVDVQTNAFGEAHVVYDIGSHTGRQEITASFVDGTDRESVTFVINGSGRPGGGEQTARLTIRVDGTGTTRAVTVTATNAQGENIPGLRVALTGTALTTSRVVNTGTATVITLPTTPDDYTIIATLSGYDPDKETLTVAASAALGTFSITTIDAPVNGQQTIEVTARNSAGTLVRGDLVVRLTGPGISRTVDTVNGTGRAIITIPTTTTSYTLTVSADGYRIKRETFTTTGQRAEAPAPPSGPAGEADSVEIDGSRQRSGTVNEELDAPLRVRVVDANDNGVEDVRVVFRVLSPGRGTFPGARGSGRATQDETDQNGYVSVDFTPISTGNVTVRATPAGGIAPVTFIIDVGEAADDDDPEPPTPSRDVGPSREISPVVHLGMASRPPMLWVDGGAIYALVGADVQKFAPGVDNALNIVIGGGKVYWTEKTGESSGTINSANLDGTDVKELKSIKAVPMGIAVDVAGSKLYWTNSRGRIQSANLDGSGITNVIPGGLESPMDLALAGSNLYWTQGNGSVRVVNLTGQQVVRNVSTGTDTPGSVVVGGNKVYWTEMTGDSSGTVNSANLNGTDVKELKSIQAVPMGIAVDGSRSKLYWTNSRGRIQSANLDGSGITNVVSGLGSPGDMVLSNSITAPAAAPAETASGSKYDVNGDGTVDNADSDAVTVAIAAGATDAKYDVNGDGTVNVFDLVEIIANRDPGAAGAPTLFGMKMSAAQIDSLQEQIDLLIATNDRSPAAMRTLIYLQQLLVTARPEKTLLLANYPNPFNPETWIPYELATDTNVKVTIYNTQGVVIRSLQLGHQSAGYYMGRDRAAYWDGRNALGEQVASGLYFYQLETDAMSLMRKMVILK